MVYSKILQPTSVNTPRLRAIYSINSINFNRFDSQCFSKDPAIECYILDNHGYVVVTKELEDTGKFFGEINGRLMQSLVSENIYEEVNITDYQGVCYANTNEGNPGNILQTVSKRMEPTKSICNRSMSRRLTNFTLCFLVIFTAIHLYIQNNQMGDQIDCMGYNTNCFTAGRCKHWCNGRLRRWVKRRRYQFENCVGKLKLK